MIGLGEKRKKELLKHFSGVEELRMARPEDITQLKGFDMTLAERILLQLNETESESKA